MPLYDTPVDEAVSFFFTNVHPQNFYPKETPMTCCAFTPTLYLQLACVLLFTGCASEPFTAQSPHGGKCRTDTVTWAIGQSATEEVGRRLLRESGAGLWRLIGPDSIVAADKRDDRISVYVNSSNVITSLSCR